MVKTLDMKYQVAAEVTGGSKASSLLISITDEVGNEESCYPMKISVDGAIYGGSRRRMNHYLRHLGNVDDATANT